MTCSHYRSKVRCVPRLVSERNKHLTPLRMKIHIRWTGGTTAWQWQREVGWAMERWKRDAEFQSVTDIKKNKVWPTVK